jgi:hypothetical protein
MVAFHGQGPSCSAAQAQVRTQLMKFAEANASILAVNAALDKMASSAHQS